MAHYVWKTAEGQFVGQERAKYGPLADARVFGSRAAAKRAARAGDTEVSGEAVPVEIRLAD